MTVSITRTEHTPDDLRREAARTSDARAARRMLARALVMEGQSRDAAARQCGMDRQTLREWVHRYNADGLAGLTGPDHATDGVIRWRVIDLRQTGGKGRPISA